MVVTFVSAMGFMFDTDW